MRTPALLAVFAIAAASTFASLPGAATPSDSWMAPGYTLSYHASVSPAQVATGAGEAVFPLVIVVGDVTASSLTLHWVHVDAAGAGASVQSTTYDRETRLGTGGGAIFWVDEDDVQAGIARFGDRWANLVLSTPLFHQFTDGNQTYTFHAETGLLLEADDISTGATLVLAGHGPGAPVAPTGGLDETVPFELAHPLVVPVMPDPEGAPVGTAGTIVRRCTGWPEIRNVFGGHNACTTQTFFAFDTFQVSHTAWLPVLGVGKVTAFYNDLVGTYMIITCESKTPVLPSPLPGPGCTVRQLRAFFPGVHWIAAEGTFSYCLNPATTFGCPWSIESRMSGGVA